MKNISETNPVYSIIVVEDEVPLRTVLVEILSHFGHEVRGVGDGVALDAALAERDAGIIVLDLNLPGENGFEISRRLQANASRGIIMTTCRGELDEKLHGYECGADIYLLKPLDPLELHAAILSLGRRLLPPPPAWRFESGLSTLYTPDGAEIIVSAQQAIVLKLLFEKPGETVLRTILLDALGHQNDELGAQCLETLISRLRTRVNKSSPGAVLPLRARHGMGYAFLADVESHRLAPPTKTG